MKNIIQSLLLISFSLAFLMMPVHAFSSEVNSSKSKYFISLKENSSILEGHKILKKYSKLSNVYLVELTPSEVSQYQNNESINYLEPDSQVNITSQEVPWSIKSSQIIPIHTSGNTGEGVKIAILDTGIDESHEDLKVDQCINFTSTSLNCNDENGHGTHVAGIVGALDNDVGVVGVSPGSALISLKVIDNNNSGTYSDVISAIEWCIDNKVNIINMSFNGVNDSVTLHDAIIKAYSSGILLVSAAGNSGISKKDNIGYPAAYDEVVTVGATDQNSARAEFSSVGKDLEIMAPGVDILSTVPGGYQYMSGTSMATPFVSAVASLVWSNHPEYTNIQVREAIDKTANHISKKSLTGFGLINPTDAVKYDAKK